MELEKIRKITGVITLRSGLHIGAGKDAVEIGGLDNPVIKNPVTNAPYIPGSSLKGKMRSLLESLLLSSSAGVRNAWEKGSPCQCGKRDCPVCVIFGVSGSVKKADELGPTRILVRDSLLDAKCEEKFRKGELPMEIKYENSIDRRDGKANPRPLERVPAGVKFNLNIGFRVYRGDPEDLLAWVFKGLRLVELDALGGSGSRGCGEVEFTKITIDGEPKYDDLNDIVIF